MEKSIELCEEVYFITENLPDIEKYGLISQIRRASVSVLSNIAEGWGRESSKEYIRFLRIAKGSLYELETQIIIAEKIDYLSSLNIKKIYKDIEYISKMLFKTIRTIEKNKD